MNYLSRIFTFIILSWSFIASAQDMKVVESTSYLPLYGTEEKIEVEAFKMDVYPVTNEDFKDFVTKNPIWQKDKVRALFVDSGYLNTWIGSTDFGDLNPKAPVTNVSWFAAKAYCEAEGKRLPTMDEWEVAAMASETLADARKEESYNKFILKWYETPRTYNNSIGSTYKNYWGLYDLQGLVWEWVSDFNSVFIAGESRKDSDFDTQLFCGSAAIGANDLKDYAAFMRYAFRGSLKARMTGRNLGFRCAADLN